MSRTISAAGRGLRLEFARDRFVNPIICDGEGIVIAGHARLLAAKRLKLTKVPVLRVADLTEAQLRAYRLADNKIAESASWDNALLRVELEFLVEAEFDTDLTGFAPTEVDLILQELPLSELEDPEPDDPARIAIPTTQDGDLFLLGEHKVLCGDIRCQATLASLVGDELIDAVITDPPYNVKVDGHVSGLGKHTHQEFSMAAGEMSAQEFESFLKTSLGNLAAVSRKGAVHFVFMDWRHILELLQVGSDIYHTFLNLCVWAKTNGGMGSLYRSQHELVAVFRVGSQQHQNNVELGKHGRYRSNVWSYAGMNSFGGDRDAALAAHPTVKPIAMIADAILDITSRGDYVMDGFLGSGSTLIAAQQIGRICYGIEIEPRYVDVAIHRWQDLTGDAAIHADSGLIFDELTEQRRINASDEEAAS